MIEHKFNNEQLKKYWEDSGKHSDNIKIFEVEFQFMPL